MPVHIPHQSSLRLPGHSHSPLPYQCNRQDLAITQPPYCPAFSSGQASKEKGHWLWESTIGRGGNSQSFFYGDHLFASVTSAGVITAWLTATAYIQDRWLLEAFLSVRAGCPQLRGPAPSSHEAYADRITLPVGHIGPYQGAGQATGRPYLADKGFNGHR